MEFGIAGWLVSEKNIDTLLFFTVEADVADVIDDEVDGAPLDDERERGEIGDLEGGDGESSLRLRELLVREVGGVRKTSIEWRFAVPESGSSALSRGMSKLRRDRVEPVPNGTAKDDRDALGVPLALVLLSLGRAGCKILDGKWNLDFEGDGSCCITFGGGRGNSSPECSVCSPPFNCGGC